jgi:hypothetical protein
MRFVRLLVLVALVSLVGAAGESAFGQQRKKNNRKKHHVFRGVVVRVHHSQKQKGHGRFVVKHHSKRIGTLIEKTFKVNDKTTFERVDKQGKKVVDVDPTTFGHLHRHQHVAVHHNGEHATDVRIVHHVKQGQ